MKQDPNRTIFVVHGPTAEWGDGQGPLSFHLTEEDAKISVQESIRDTISIANDDPDVEVRTYEAAAEALGWPFTMAEYEVSETTLFALFGGTREEWALAEMQDLDDEALFEHLNSN